MAEREIPVAWIDFNARDENGLYWTVVPRGTVGTNAQLHVYDGEGNCALMDVVAVSDLHENADAFDRFTRMVVHLEMLNWHGEADPFYPGMEKENAS